MSKELMEQVIKDFGNEIGAELEVDEDAYCCLAVGDDMQIHLKFNEHFNGLIFYSELGEPPNFGRKEILRHYTYENGQPTSNGMTFSYDVESKQIGMARLLYKDFMDLENFKKILEKFIERNIQEKEKMATYLQGELPKDEIQFTEEEQEEAPAGPML
ncbi:MAG: type III secretion system chaperone [Opitutales bacterium]|nr:type III secretion system chaperone [Opitutales bacterium]